MARGPKFEEHRKDKRIKQWNKALLSVRGAGPGPTGPMATDAYTYDVSLGGARIHSHERIMVGTRISLKIEFVRSHETVVIDGQVKWMRPCEVEGVYEMGVEFEHTSSATIMSLMRNLHDTRR